MRLVAVRIPIYLLLTLSLVLTSCGGGSSSRRAGVPPPSVIEFGAAAFTVSETGGAVAVTVSRLSGTSGAVAVDYATSDSTATAGADYTGASGTVGWASGDATDQTFTVNVSDDLLVEGDETVTLTLSNPTAGASLGTQFTAVLTILDDDTPAAGAIQFGAPTFNFGEGDGTVTIGVTRSGGTSGAVSVDYSTADGTATNPADYISASGTLSWADGDGADKSFTVDIREDGAAEGSETIDLSLASPTGGAVLGTQGTSVITILDNDSFGSIQFSASTYTTGAFSGQAVITVERVGGTSGAVSVNYTATGGTATPGSDFLAPPGVLSWADGDGAVKTFTVTVIDDVLAEANETVDLSLTNPTGGANLGGTDFATLTIEEGWVKDATNPVLSPSPFGTAFDDEDVAEPCVLGPANGLPQYAMWYTGDDQATGTEQIGFATSADGVSWTKFGPPVLTPGALGSWDELSVSGPHVVYDAPSGVLMMFYNGEDFMGVFQMGLATSMDGVNWTKSPSNPVFTPGLPGAWDGGAVAYASVLEDAGLYKMWYTAVDAFSPLGVVQIGYATSPDGINWTRHPGNPILAPTLGAFDSIGVGFPSVIQDGATFRMVYTGNVAVAGMQPMSVGYAVSNDGGVTWAKYQNIVGTPMPILDVGTPGSWDEWTLFKASWFTSDPAELWYQGEGGFVGSHIGRATHP